MSSGSSCTRHRCTDKSNRSCADCRKCQSGHSRTCDWRNLFRRRLCFKFPAGYRNPVLLSFFNGRQRIHCPRCFLYGQTAQKNRSVRQKHCTDADWIWLYRSGCHVHQNTSKWTWPENDHSFDSVYELQCQTSNLCIFCKCILPGTWRADHGRTLYSWHCDGYPDRPVL